MATILFSLIFCGISVVFAQGDVLSHTKAGPLVLTDQIVQEIFKEERRPFKHNGITVTDYFKGLDVEYAQPRVGCFRPVIKKWLVESKIYVRPKKVMGPDGKAIGNLRWSELKRHACREADSDFNTWEGTLYHEEQHFFARDTMLKDFWKELKGALNDYCSGSVKEAQEFLLGILGSFIQEVHQADSEQRAEALEAKWYLARAEQGCKGPLDFIVKALPGAKVKQEAQLIKVNYKGEEFSGLKKGSLLVLINKQKGSAYYFQFGSLLAHELTEDGGPVRLEYSVDGRLKHKVWLNAEGKVSAKAWADLKGKLGKKVNLALAAETVAPVPAVLVSILDTGFENSDEDGHGTFVRSMVSKGGALIESLKVTSNLDESLWTALSAAQGKIINLSIGQGVNSSKPPTQEAIDKTCKQVKELSKTKLIVMGAGNDGSLLEKASFYPASCPWTSGDAVLVVGAWDPLNLAGADFGRTTSNWSPSVLEVMVSGGLFSGNYPGDAAAVKGGTSFSAAFVSGLAAKIWNAKSDLTAALIKEAVLSRCVTTERAQGWVKKGCVLQR